MGQHRRAYAAKAEAMGLAVTVAALDVLLAMARSAALDPSAQP